MWCKNCRQDTPGIRSPRQPGLRCGQCGSALTSEAAQRGGPADSGHPAEIGLDLEGARSQAVNFEQWELDQNLRSLEARLGPWRRRDTGPYYTAPASRTPQYRFDAAHTMPAGPQNHRRRMRVDRPARRSNILAHLVLWSGLAVLAAGGGVLGWSAYFDAQRWQQLGAPLAAAGACVFLVGIVWQLERIWRNSRFAVQKLRQLDGQIRQLEHTASMLGVTHGSPSQSFYAHMAEGANPHMLLADLKGQIDLLAMNFARH